MSFPSAHPALARALVARGYQVPTPVQLAVLEAEAAGRDLLVSAQTGSGKTVAFGLAMAPALLGEAETLPPAAEPLALIIAPTRELALQVQRELVWLYQDAGARIVTCVGGMDVRSEARQLERGAHIVVGTPGRLRDHLERRRLDLSKLAAVVLDEADEMLDLGFREDLEFILDATPASRQTLLFSATMPREIENLAGRYQRDAARIETLRRDEQHADIEYRAMRVAPNDIEHAVVNVLRFYEMPAALVFCATRESVKRLHMRLVERGFSAVALSGELTQSERTHALQAVRDGRARVLVATDVAARGLDLPALSLVIHADLPTDAETLLHRSGRTGRAGNKGLCVLIVPFNRRRKADVLLAGAKLKVTWAPAPTADEIRTRDQERFIESPIFTEAASEEDVRLAQLLQARRTPDEIALALVRANRAGQPAPEDLAEDAGPPWRRDANTRTLRERGGRRNEEHRSNERGPEAHRSDDRRPSRPPRDHGRDMVWFRVDIGRERNADPRWLLPLLCRAGGVTKSEIGAIKIFDRDTRFEVAAEFAEKFADTIRTVRPTEARISRVGDNAEREPAASPRPRHKDRPRKHRDENPAAASGPSSAEAQSEPPRRERDHKPAWRDRAEPSRADGRPDRTERPDRKPAHHDRKKKRKADGSPAARDGGSRPERIGFPKKPHRKGQRRPAASAQSSGGDRPLSRAPHGKPGHKKKHRAGPKKA